jgi:exodeoxyribonuclease V gamma subunit
VQALEKLLDLPQSRLAVSDLLDLLDVPALRQRFGHRRRRAAAIAALDSWRQHSLGPARRAARQPRPAAGRRKRRRRIPGCSACGACCSATPLAPTPAAWRDIEPYDEIGGIDAALLGPLVQLLDTLEATWRMLREPATWPTGACACANCWPISSPPTTAATPYTLLQLDTALERWQEACDEAALVEPLPLSVVGEHWLSRLDEGSLSQRFFGGVVTFATLMPMRAIPFRQVCLLGMNDGDYPRSRIPMDFDLMARDYRPGDRSRREDDRYLFLEALLSARESLHISWVGRSINDNSERPPSVLVGQLRDHLAAGWRLAGEAGRGGCGRRPARRPDRRASAAALQSRTISRRTPGQPAWFTYAEEWPGPGAFGEARRGSWRHPWKISSSATARPSRAGPTSRRKSPSSSPFRSPARRWDLPDWLRAIRRCGRRGPGGAGKQRSGEEGHYRGDKLIRHWVTIWPGTWPGAP